MNFQRLKANLKKNKRKPKTLEADSWDLRVKLTPHASDTGVECGD
jgi:hypothetical protein